MAVLCDSRGQVFRRAQEGRIAAGEDRATDGLFRVGCCERRRQKSARHRPAEARGHWGQPQRLPTRPTFGMHRLPKRFRSYPKTTSKSGFHPQLRRFPTYIGSDAPVWCHPRQREEAGMGYSSLDGGRHPTEASHVVANPRIAAGSTVGSDWLRLFRCTKGKRIRMT
jgi:hypothetical protein